MDLFNAITAGGELDSTPSYPFRSWHWVASERLLVIRVQSAKRLDGRSEIDAYQVEEQDAPDWPGRIFLLHNVTDPKQEQPYQVFLGDRGADACTCKAGVHGRDCKHKDSLRAAVAAGAFETTAPKVGTGSMSALAR